MSDINVQNTTQPTDRLRDPEQLEEDRIKTANGQIQTLITELTLRMVVANFITQAGEDNRKQIDNSIREIKQTQRESQELIDSINRLRDIQQHSSRSIAPTDAITANGHANAGIDALNLHHTNEENQAAVDAICKKYGIDLGGNDFAQIMDRLRAKMAASADSLSAQLEVLHEFVGRYEAQARDTGAAVGAAKEIAARIESELGGTAGSAG